MFRSKQLRRWLWGPPAFVARRASGLLQVDLLQILAQTRSEIVSLEREVDGGLQHASLVAGVVALAGEGKAVDFFVVEQPLDAVGQLQLSAGTLRNVFEKLEDAWGKDVAADDGVFRRRVRLLWLFHHLRHRV